MIEVVECLLEHGTQIDVQDNVSDEWELSFVIDVSVTMTFLYFYMNTILGWWDSTSSCMLGG